MAYSSYDMNEGEVIQPSFSWGSCEYEGVLTNDDHLSSDATFYACPFFDSCSYHQEGLLKATNPSPSWEEESGFPTSPWNNTLQTRESYDGEPQPYHGCGNWLSKCNSVFNGCWEDNYDSLGNANDNNSENTETCNINENFDASSFPRRDDEDTENYPAASDYNPWSCCDSWLAHGQENESLASGREETDVAYERVLRDTGVYEGIFGYWPCLRRSH